MKAGLKVYMRHNTSELKGYRHTHGKCEDIPRDGWHKGREIQVVCKGNETK